MTGLKTSTTSSFLKTPPKKPTIAYQYVVLPDYPGKVFKVRCEEISEEAHESLVSAFVPTKEKVYEVLASSPRRWPSNEPVVNVRAQEPVIVPPPKKAWWRYVVDYLDPYSHIRNKRHGHRP